MCETHFCGELIRKDAFFLGARCHQCIPFILRDIPQLHSFFSHLGPLLHMRVLLQ